MILNKLSQQVYMRRTMFNPKDKTHIKEYKFFVENHKWRDICPFWLEWPYLTVPDMIKDKMIKHILDV